MSAPQARETPGMQAIFVALICVAAIVLSLKSILALGRHAPWTSAGWWLTVAYLAAVIVKGATAYALPLHGEYVILLLLTLAFVVAGVRDERQAEPWWWPSRLGATRAEKQRPA